MSERARPPAGTPPGPPARSSSPPGPPAGTPPGEEIVRVDATVIGRVQGVGFRWFVLDVARDLELRGWVANEMDGSVRCAAEGPRATVEALVTELWRGPLGADVERVITRWSPAAGTLGPFVIRSLGHRGD